MVFLFLLIKIGKIRKNKYLGFFCLFFFDSGDTKLVLTLSSSRHHLVTVRSREIPKLVTEITSKVLTRLCCRLRVMRQVFHLSEILVDRQFVVSDLLMRYVYNSPFVRLLGFLHKLWCSVYVLVKFVNDWRTKFWHQIFLVFQKDSS